MEQTYKEIYIYSLLSFCNWYLRFIFDFQLESVPVFASGVIMRYNTIKPRKRITRNRLGFTEGSVMSNSTPKFLNLTSRDITLY